MANDVLWSPDGLTHGILGMKNTIVIDARKAIGNEELRAVCSGPTQLALCEFIDNKDGMFTLAVAPQEDGEHQLDITLADEHVPRSPHRFYVFKHQPGPQNIRVSGQGITHGVLGMYNSSFSVDTTGAGPGMISVRVAGPRGAFKVEMTRIGRQIECRYHPRMEGEYTVNIFWAEQHVPGSPFEVHMFQNKKNLDKFIHRQRNKENRFIEPN